VPLQRPPPARPDEGRAAGAFRYHTTHHKFVAKIPAEASVKNPAETSAKQPNRPTPSRQATYLPLPRHCCEKSLDNSSSILYNYRCKELRFSPENANLLIGPRSQATH